MAYMPGNHVVHKKSVVDRVIDSITQDIIRGRYPPGSKLPNEYDLVLELNVSRNSLREAIKILSAAGIVEIRQGDGTYVCSQAAPSLFDGVVYSIISSTSSNEELIELRGIVDEMTLRLASQKAEPQEIDALEENVQKMKDAIQRNDIQQAQQLDMEFHSLLTESCRNTLYIRMISGLYTIFQNSIGDTLDIESAGSRAPVFHEQMLECIRTHDDARIRGVVEESLTPWKQQLARNAAAHSRSGASPRGKKASPGGPRPSACERDSLPACREIPPRK